MYQIIKDGALLALTEAPTYVHLKENGCFALCAQDQAQGIAHGGTVYHLLGREAIEGAETVMLEETDAGSELATVKETLAAADETAIELYEAQAAQEEINTQQDAALLEIYELLEV